MYNLMPLVPTLSNWLQAVALNKADIDSPTKDTAQSAARLSHYDAYRTL